MRKLILDEGQFRLHLMHLCGGNLNLGGLPLGHRFVILLAILFELTERLHPFEPQFSVIERTQDLAGTHHITGAKRRLPDIAVERRRSRPLNDRLQDRLGRDAIVALREQTEEHEARESRGRQLQRRMTGAQQVATIASESIPNLGPDPPIVTTMDLQHGTGERRYRSAEHNTLVVERSFRRPFQ